MSSIAVVRKDRVKAMSLNENGSVATLQTRDGGASNEAGGAGEGVPSGYGAYTCVIDACAYGRSALSTLARRQLGGEVISLASPQAQQDWPRSALMLPVRALVYRLPQSLGAALDALMFLKRFLLRQSGQLGVVTSVLLLTNLPAFWVYGTLRSISGSELNLQAIFVVPVRTSPAGVTAALAFRNDAQRLSVLAARTPASKRRSLTAREAEVLHDLLHHGRTIAAQARRKCTMAKTLYTQQRSAMRKLGVSSLCGLVRWRGGTR